MSPAVYFSFQQVIKAYYCKKFDKDRYKIISLSCDNWQDMTVKQAIEGTYHVLDTVSYLYLYPSELDDIMKGRKVERLDERS